MTDEIYDFGLDPGESFEPEELDDEIDLDGPHVMTALGPIEPGALGVTLPTQHVIVQPTGAETVDADFWLDSADSAFAELEDAFYAGLRAVVDITAIDRGRDPASLYWVAQRAPVHVVVATGYSGDMAQPDDDRVIAGYTAQMIDEIKNGVVGTSIRAGVIVTGDRIATLRAAIETHLETGVPIVLTGGSAVTITDRLILLQDVGIAGDRIIIRGFDFDSSEDDLIRVLGTGAFVVFDRISNGGFDADLVRAKKLQQLAAAGYLDQLLVGGDLHRKSSWLAYGGTPGLRYLVESFPVIMMEAGFTAPEVLQILADNPQQALTIRPPV